MSRLTQALQVSRAIVAEPRRLRKLSRIVGAIINDPRRLANVLDEELAKRRYAQQHLQATCGLPTIDLLDLFPGFEETVDPYSFLEGTSPCLDLALLKALARRIPNCRYLEIGSWRGESLANVAQVAAECISISLSDDEIRKSGCAEEFVTTSRFYSKGLSNVTHIGHDSQSFDFSPYANSIDLVFVDGDHSFECVRRDTQNAHSLLRDEGSAIVWHDYGFSPERIRWAVYAGILDGTPVEKRKYLYHVSNTMCAIYSREPITAKQATHPQVPDKRFTVRISARPEAGDGN